MKKWDGSGNLMTIEKWKSKVAGGYFIDEDGFGEFSDGVNVENDFPHGLVYPSDIYKPDFNPLDYSHIVWYNK